jgi:hypothetical protein
MQASAAVLEMVRRFSWLISSVMKTQEHDLHYSQRGSHACMPTCIACRRAEVREPAMQDPDGRGKPPAVFLRLRERLLVSSFSLLGSVILGTLFAGHARKPL